MKVDIKKWRNFITKATLNNSISSISFTITEDRVTTKMIKSSNDAIVCLDFENDIFKDVEDELTFDFNDPASSILPFIGLMDEEECEVLVRNEKLILKQGKQKSNLFFCEPEVPTKFGASEPKDIFKPFVTLKIDNEFIGIFNKIKGVGSRFGKLYFTVSNNILAIETTDKKNKFSNGLSFELSGVTEEDLTVCYDFTNFRNLMSVLSNDISYIMEFIYIKDKKMGMVTCKRENPLTDSVESYYLLSKEEN